MNLLELGVIRKADHQFSLPFVVRLCQFHLHAAETAPEVIFKFLNLFASG
jgi:hypothetical protein